MKRWQEGAFLIGIPSALSALFIGFGGVFAVGFILTVAAVIGTYRREAAEA